MAVIDPVDADQVAFAIDPADADQATAELKLPVPATAAVH